MRRILSFVSLAALTACTTTQVDHTPEVINARKIAPFHVVQFGETVTDVALKFNMDEETLIYINKLTPPYTLIKGQRLVVYKDVKRTATPHQSGGIEITPLDEEGTLGSQADDAQIGPDGFQKSDEKALIELAKPTARVYDWPVKGDVITKFGNGKGEKVSGVDIAAPRGTPVFAIAPGEVYRAQTLPGLGKTVLVRHDDGKMSIYGHLHTTTVKAEQRVTPATKIGSVGKSGNVKRTMLHLQVRDEGKKAIDPISLFKD